MRVLDQTSKKENILKQIEDKGKVFSSKIDEAQDQYCKKESDQKTYANPRLERVSLQGKI